MARRRKNKKADFFEDNWPILLGGALAVGGIAFLSSSGEASADDDAGLSDLGSFAGDLGTFDYQETARPVAISPKTTQEAPIIASKGTNRGADLVASAMTLIGTPYGPDIGGPTKAGMENYLDCSGTIFQAARKLGVPIPRNATGQYLRARTYRMISEDEARNTAGALIFFHNPNTEGTSAFHVELSTGDGGAIHNHQPGTKVKRGRFGWWHNWAKRNEYTVTFGILPEFAG